MRLWALLPACAIALASCSGAYRQAVEKRVASLPDESRRVYAGCVRKPCSAMIPDFAMQMVLSNAQLACLVDTDNGTKAADSLACACSQGATDDVRTPKCEKWMQYSEPPTAPSSAKVQPAPSTGDGGAP